MNGSTSVSNPQGQWNSLASRWDKHGSPLRPSQLDAAHYQAAVDDLARRRAIDRAVILGVTPEIYRLTWPEDTTVLAIDRSRDMIERVWPGPRERALLGEWTEPLLEAGSVQIAICDGGFHLLDYPVGQTALVAQLARMLDRGGRAVFRLFLPPSDAMTPEAVIAALAAGQIPNMNVLKLRLGHALMRSPEDGVALDAVWTFLHDHIGDRDAFFADLGPTWKDADVIDLYRGSPARYHFASLDAVKRLFVQDGAGLFEIVAVNFPDQLLGDQCPHLIVERK